MNDVYTDWNKFYGEVCPVCKQPVMTKEWKKEQYFCSTGYLRDHGYRVDKHAKFVIMEQNHKNHRFYPVHRECSQSMWKDAAWRKAMKSDIYEP